MTTVTVLEFQSRDLTTGEPIWPPYKSTDVVVPGSMRTQQGTVLFSVSTDTNCRIGVDNPATAYSTPILSAVANDFITGTSAGELLTFI